MSYLSDLGESWGELRDSSGMNLPFRKRMQVRGGLEVADASSKTTISLRAYLELPRLLYYPRTITGSNGRLYVDPLFSRPRWQCDGQDRSLPAALWGGILWGSTTFVGGAVASKTIVDSDIEANMLMAACWGTPADGARAVSNRLLVSATNLRTSPGSFRLDVYNDAGNVTCNPYVGWVAIRVGGPAT